MSESKKHQSGEVAATGSSTKTWSVGTLTYSGAGLLALFGWLLWGDFAWALRERAIFPMVQFMLKNLETSDFMVGILIGTFPSIIAAVLQPIISYRSDRHRGRWGRRIPYLLVTTPITGISMMCLAAVPFLGGRLDSMMGASSFGIGASSLIFFAIFWTIFEFGTIAAGAVFGGLVNDVVPQRLLGRFFGLFRAVSLLAGIIFNAWVFGHVEGYYKLIFVVIGAIYAGGFLLMCWRVKEGDYPAPPVVEEKQHGFIGAVKIYFKECFTHPMYRWFFVAYALCFAAFVPVNLFSLFFAQSLDISFDAYGKYLAITFSISLVISYGLGSLADRFHPLRMGMVTIGVYGALAIWAGFFMRSEALFAVGFIAHGVLSGTFMTTTASIGQRIFPKDRFAQFFSALTLVMSLGTAVVPMVTGYILDVSDHEYRYIFLCSGVLALTGLALFFVVNAKFKKLGGVKSYEAPL
jgi:MFS family permease